MNQVSLSLSSFGAGSGMVALILGIAHQDWFLFYTGMICFISNLVNIIRYYNE